MENLNPSAIALIVACLAFYAKLMWAQRQKVKAWEMGQHTRSASGRKKGSRKNPPSTGEKPSFGSFSRNKRDWVVGGVGYILIMLGVLLYAGIIQHDYWSTMWWLPTSFGIVGFSWFFS